jgi:hypothetical protein
VKSETDLICLIAIAPSGAVLVVRDRDGRLWLYPPEGAGVPRMLDDRLAEQVIARQGLKRVDREFGTWAELDEFREEYAAQTAPDVKIDVAGLDAEDVEGFLAVAERWLADGDLDRSRRLLVRLLRVPALGENADTYERLVTMLEGFDAPPRPALRSEPRTPLQEAARERFDMARAA